MKDINITSFVPVGHSNAVSRHQLCLRTGLCDRSMRIRIEEAKKDTPIVNVGFGYFIPDTDDPVDLAYAKAYALQEEARIKSTRRSIERVRKAIKTAEQQAKGQEIRA